MEKTRAVVENAEGKFEKVINMLKEGSVQSFRHVESGKQGIKLIWGILEGNVGEVEFCMD